MKFSSKLELWRC